MSPVAAARRALRDAVVDAAVAWCAANESLTVADERGAGLDEIERLDAAADEAETMLASAVIGLKNHECGSTK